MGRTIRKGHCRGRPAVVALLSALLTIGALAVAAGPAFGWTDYEHSAASTCASCHPGGNTGTTPTNAACAAASCHPGFVAQPTDKCWTCHKPGVAPGATAADCTGTCHEWSGPDTFTDTPAHAAIPHLGANLEPCTTCHAMSISSTNPGTSPHHNGESAANPTCTTCHAATPVDNAPAPHPVYVASVACPTCHVGMSPHPTAAATPTVALTASIGTAGATYRAVSAGVAGSPVVLPAKTTATPVTTGAPATLAGTLMNGTAPLAGVTLYLQIQAAGSASFTLLGTAKTDATGAFAFTEPIKATITLKLSSTSIKLHKSVTAKGVLGPASLHGLSVKLTAQRKVGAKWLPAGTKTKATAAATGAFSWKYTPAKRGSYRLFATIAKTAQHTAAKSPVRSFKVK